MKKLSLLFFIVLAYQNCSDVSLIKNGNETIDKYSLFEPLQKIDNGRIFASNDTHLVTCRYSTLSLYNLQSLALIDTETISGYCNQITIANQWIAVSSNNTDISVFKIENNELVNKQTINKPTASTSASGFANSIAISDSLLVVGDLYHNINPTGREGAAYVYRRSGDTWNLEQQILSTDPSNSELFGHQVGLSSNNVFVSARYDNNQGAVYVFGNLNSSTSWSQVQKIRSPDNFNDQQFGFSVSIDENHLAISAVAVTGSPTELSKGTVFIYEKSADWQFKDRIVASNPNNSDFFGYKLSLKYPLLAVSAPQHYSNPVVSGYVSIFKMEQGAWALKQEINEDSVFQYGSNLQLLDSRLLIGASDADSSDPLFIYQPLAN